MKITRSQVDSPEIFLGGFGGGVFGDFLFLGFGFGGCRVSGIVGFRAWGLFGV